MFFTVSLKLFSTHSTFYYVTVAVYKKVSSLIYKTLQDKGKVIPTHALKAEWKGFIAPPVLNLVNG
jgi:hypothetical protein